jgi:3-keto-5-aminohexanoate cleavage enzyme
MEPLIINAAITGMVPRKADNPHVPIHPDEIVADARRCRDAGATILHVHARQIDETPTYAREVYQEILQGIREECPELLVSASCSGRLHNLFEQRSQVLDLQPDLGSLTLGSLNFPQTASVNDPQMVRQLATAMRDRGIMPELEIFDLGMADFTHYLIEKGFIAPPIYANILLGNLGTLAATPDNLCAVVRALPRGAVWAATGVGRFQFFVNSLAIVMGGHVRVGLEDAIYYDWNHRSLATNAGLIDRVVRLAQAVGRPISTAAQTRAMLGRGDTASGPTSLPLRRRSA